MLPRHPASGPGGAPLARRYTAASSLCSLCSASSEKRKNRLGFVTYGRVRGAASAACTAPCNAAAPSARWQERGRKKCGRCADTDARCVRARLGAANEKCEHHGQAVRMLHRCRSHDGRAPPLCHVPERSRSEGQATTETRYGASHCKRLRAETHLIHRINPRSARNEILGRLGASHNVQRRVLVLRSERTAAIAQTHQWGGAGVVMRA